MMTQIKRLQIEHHLRMVHMVTKDNRFEAVVDDAIISYDITINPNSYPELLSQEDLDLFMNLYGRNKFKKNHQQKTDSKLLLLIKFKIISWGNVKH